MEYITKEKIFQIYIHKRIHINLQINKFKNKKIETKEILELFNSIKLTCTKIWQAWDAIWKRPSCKLCPVCSIFSERLLPFQVKKDIAMHLL